MQRRQVSGDDILHFTMLIRLESVTDLRLGGFDARCGCCHDVLLDVALSLGRYKNCRGVITMADSQINFARRKPQIESCNVLYREEEPTLSSRRICTVGG